MSSSYPEEATWRCSIKRCCWKFCKYWLENIPVDTGRRFNVYKTSIRRRRRLIEVETTSCVYWGISQTHIYLRLLSSILTLCAHFSKWSVVNESSPNFGFSINPLYPNPTKWSNTLKQFVGNLPTNCLSVLDHFVVLALKGISKFKRLSYL